MITSYNYQYKDDHDLANFITQNNISGENLLVQVFTGICDREYIERLINKILHLLPKARILGATTAGEIIDDKVLNNSAVLSFTFFEHTRIKTSLIHNHDNLFSIGGDIAGKLITDDTKALILFSCGIEDDLTMRNGSELLKGVESVIKHDIIVAGGQAGDNKRLKETFVFTEQEITEKGVAGVSFNSKILQVKSYSDLGWEPIGKQMTLTKVEGCRIYSLDNIPATRMYEKYLGSEIAKSLDTSATQFPFIVERNKFEIAKHATNIHEKEGSLDLISSFQEGEKVRFGFGHVELIAKGVRDMARKIAQEPSEVIFIYSCASRKWLLEKHIADIEILPLNKIAPCSGFYTYGEFLSRDSSLIFLNQTLTVLSLSETPEHIKAIDLSEIDKVHDSLFTDTEVKTITALHHLVETVTKELEKTNEKIQESIRYAKRIQSALVPSYDELKTFLPKSFIIWEPKETIGGDMFFTDFFEHGFVIAVIDCTGHGVPGAFMTMLASSALKRIVHDEKCHDPAEILKRMNIIVKEQLKQDTEQTPSDDGLDAAVCFAETKQRILTFAGARLPLYYVRNGKLSTIKGDTQSIGYRRSDINFNYKKHTLTIEDNMSFYLSTDGFWSQLGGERRRRFNIERYENLLKKNSKESFDRQKDVLLQAFHEYKGEHVQTDDVAVAGFGL